MSTNTSFIEDFEHVHSSGVVTKAKPQTKPPEEKKLLEVKVNITESELVVVEDISAPDTQTVILKVTSVLAYRPNHFSERPVTCSLQNLEVFSCLMNQPDSSALSIVDPVAFLVELNSSKKTAKTSSPGLQDAMKMKPVLEVCLSIVCGCASSFIYVVLIMIKIILPLMEFFVSARISFWNFELFDLWWSCLQFFFELAH